MVCPFFAVCDFKKKQPADEEKANSTGDGNKNQGGASGDEEEEKKEGEEDVEEYPEVAEPLFEEEMDGSMALILETGQTLSLSLGLAANHG